MTMQQVLNLTQHTATPEQLQNGVVEPSDAAKEKIQALLTFDELPSYTDIVERAIAVTALAQEVITNEFDNAISSAMIGGAPFLMSELEFQLTSQEISPLYAFSKREVREIEQEDGSVSKHTIFRFEGFVNACITPQE